MRILSIFALLAAVLTAACAANTPPIQPVTSIPASDLTALPTASPRPPTEQAPAAPTLPPAQEAGAQPTPTPLDINLEIGQAAAIAAATDTAFQPTARSFIAFENALVPLTFDEFYDGFSIRYGLILSDKLVSLDGKNITIEGYMAPPLKPELDYFVLTAIRLAFCPFCSTAADWPDDIALVYMTNGTATVTEYGVRVNGRLEVGASVDQETGMVSLVRIYADNLEILG